MGSSASLNGPFCLLPETRKPWTEFAFGIGTQALLVLLLVSVPLFQPQILDAVRHDYHAIELVPTPAPVNHQPQPVRVFKQPVVVAHLDPPVALHLPTPTPRPRAVEDTRAPEVKVSTKVDALPPIAGPIVPKQLVRTNVFSTGSSATPTIARAPDKVQTGGFGDPNGIPAKGNANKAVNIAQLGGFDMPVGPGSGNGTGGANGARGVVASSGFGNGVATGDGSGRVSASRVGGVRQAGFGDADVAAPATVRSRPAEVAARVIPAEILSKPSPIYTPEARSLKIEGEVLLEVVLGSDGRLHVTKVVRGLGHGLDDAAVKAAEQIRFKPAQKDGQPTDSTAVLHIIFQLA